MRLSLSTILLSASLVGPIQSFVVAPSIAITNTNINAVRTSTTTRRESKDDAEKERKAIAWGNNKPTILDPFLPAMDPKYSVTAPVGEGDFVVSREGEPTAEELTNENLLKIVASECTDLECNTLVWKCLGYRFDAEKEEWTAEKVFPKWKERFPTPPDLIGMRRQYSKEIDGPSLRSNQQLVKSIPVDNKQSLKKHLKPLGFTGFKVCSSRSRWHRCTSCVEVIFSVLSRYKPHSIYHPSTCTQVAELTPNKTRRAQCANWLLFYREELFGYTVEELKERRRLKQEKEEQERLQKIKEGAEDKKEWKPPVKEVF